MAEEDHNKDQWMERARSAFTSSSDYFDSNIRRQMERSILQYQGKHPPGSKYNSEAYRTRSKYFRPKTRSAIRKNTALCAAAFFSTEDAVNVRPTDEDDIFNKLGAEGLKYLMRRRLSNDVPEEGIPWFLILNGAYEEAQTVGVICSYNHWEYDEELGIDRPAVDLQPPENIRFAKSAKWYDPINTSPYVIRMIPMYVMDVKERMAEVNPKTGQPKWKPLTDGQIKAATKNTYDSLRMAREKNRTDSTDTAGDVSDFEIVWVHEFIMRGPKGKDMVFYTLGMEDRLTDPVPLKEVYHHGMRPFTYGFVIIEPHRLYPTTIPELTRDVQSEANDIANLRLDNVRFVLNKRYFVKRNRQVDLRSLRRNSPGSSTLMVDPEKDVKVVETNDVTSSSYQEQDRLNLDFDDLAGTFSGSSVQANRKMNETVGGMNLLANSAGQVGELQLSTFTYTWVEPTLRHIAALIKTYETNEDYLAAASRYIKINQQLGLPEGVIQTLPDGFLDQRFFITTNVGIGTSNPAQQVEKFIYGLSSLTKILGERLTSDIDLDEVVKELFGKLGYKDGARFFSSLRGNEDPRVMELMKMVEQLQQALQAKEPQEIIDAKVEKLLAEAQSINAATMQKGVESRFAAIQAAENIAAVPELTPIADNILEASGWQRLPPPSLGSSPGLIESYGRNNGMYDPDHDEQGPGDPDHDEYAQARENTSPMEPPVPSTGQSPYQGIETQEFD